MSAAGTVLLKLDSLQSLENYTKSVYYSNYPMTPYFKVYLENKNAPITQKAQLQVHLKLRKKERKYDY